SSLKGIFWNPSNRRSLTAAVLMGAAAVLSQWLWPAGPETSGLWRGGVLIGVIGGSALVYAGLVLGFGVPEVKDLAAQVRARFKRGAL
ncbi:MAG: hypothetical protein QGG90_11465, partial [Nitrospinota bacterium]|nr:hypothetical protein [Nitrospinota bacterium]